jgi:hypothetical protein
MLTGRLLSRMAVSGILQTGTHKYVILGNGLINKQGFLFKFEKLNSAFV